MQSNTMAIKSRSCFIYYLLKKQLTEIQTVSEWSFRPMFVIIRVDNCKEGIVSVPDTSALTRATLVFRSHLGIVQLSGHIRPFGCPWLAYAMSVGNKESKVNECNSCTQSNCIVFCFEGDCYCLFCFFCFFFFCFFNLSTCVLVCEHMQLHMLANRCYKRCKLVVNPQKYQLMLKKTKFYRIQSLY